MNFFESSNDFVSLIISDNNFEVLFDLERQIIFLAESFFFQLLPTSFNQTSKLISQFGSAAIPKASRYHLSFPSYFLARYVQIFADSDVGFNSDKAIKASRETCKDLSSLTEFKISNISISNCLAALNEVILISSFSSTKPSLICSIPESLSFDNNQSALALNT